MDGTSNFLQPRKVLWKVDNCVSLVFKVCLNPRNLKLTILCISGPLSALLVVRNRRLLDTLRKTVHLSQRVMVGKAVQCSYGLILHCENPMVYMYIRCITPRTVVTALNFRVNLLTGRLVNATDSE